MSTSEHQQRIENLERLLEVTRVLAAECDLDKLLATVVHLACQALRCDRATIFLYDEPRRELYTRCFTDLEVSEIRLSIDEGVAGQVARTRQLRHVENADQDPHHARTVAARVGYRVRNMITAPLISLPEDRLVGVIQVLNKLHGQPFDRHDEQLLSAFASHAAIALDRARLLDEYRAKQQIEASLAVARQIQQALFPEQMPALPGYDLAGRSVPCDATGGDYYDALALPDGRVALVLADVSGHGVGPSLLMASARAAVHALATQLTEPPALVSRLNSLLCQDLSGGHFITFFYGVLDSRSHTLAYSSGGQGPVWHYAAAADTFINVPATDIPLGVMPDGTYSLGQPVRLAPHDLLILPSDGILEAMNDRGEHFEAGRLHQVLHRCRDRSCAEIIDAVFQAVTEWVQPHRPQDDVTLLVARRLETAG